MTKDEAVSHAQAFVRSKFPIVPPVFSVQHVTVRQLGCRERLHIEHWMRLGGATDMHHAVSLLDVADITDFKVEAVAGKWFSTTISTFVVVGFSW